MATNFEKFQTLLEELFQLDQADLDFGIYRIMNQKRDDVVRFLENDLLPQVKTAFSQYQSVDKATLQRQLDKAIKQSHELGVDPETTMKVQELRQQMTESGVDITALESEVFSHLYNFFRRYYHEGDFISLRRYKEGVYAIPYEGEEVKLHWANHDQYYIKSSEYFRDYIFTLASGKRVRAHLVAASSEQDNKKEAPGKERRFIICAEEPVYEKDGELYIRFEYRADDGKKKQDALNQKAIERVLQAEGFDEWIRELSKPAPTTANPNRTVLEKHLKQYTARNTFDYFIHKDLGGFLRRELDFYIKNEVMHLDDIEHDTAPRVEQYLSKIKVIRKIAHKIIQFLEQLENFQKKLWLKKKFVVETNYCITLDRVPEALYPEIAANDAQREEWVQLFGIDEIEKDLHRPGYSEPLTVEFLQAFPSLPVDTGFFSHTFSDRAVASLDSIDAELSGTLISGDNFHALSLLDSRFHDQLPFCYIDPPYNTGNDEFIYKDNYQHSSWLTLFDSRLKLLAPLLNSNGVLACSLDDTESANLNNLVESAYPSLSRMGEFVWRTRNTDNRVSSNLSVDHEYIYIYSAQGTSIRGRVIDRSNFTNPDNDPRGRYTTDPLTGKANAIDRPNLHFEVVNPKTRDVYPPHPDFGWITDKAGFQHLIDEDLVHWPANPKTGNPRKKRFLLETNERAPISSVGISIKQGEGNQDLSSLMGNKALNFPKPVSVIRTVIDVCCPNDGTVLDYFAGSGTTGQAVIELNREGEIARQFILVEMGAYFDSILRPRILKSIHADGWKDGKPTSRNGSSATVKYIRLESYEDALNNLAMKQTDQQTLSLEQNDDLREQYILSYMLDVESRGSQSLLNIESFRNPDQYKLRVERNGETQLVNVDLVETFNWLLGLTVKHIDIIDGVRTVKGTNPEGDRTLVLWRNLDETDNDGLDEWFIKQNVNTQDQEYDLVYVNGDNNLENFRHDDMTWKVRLIEEEFGRLMFDVEDV